MAHPLPLTGLSLFSGVGMLDEAVGIALARRGVEYRTAAFCEWEASAASLLLARMEEQSLAPSPVFCGDLADFPAELFARRIDLLTAGYPCQPYSVAGAKRGLADPRALGDDGQGPIHHLLRIVDTVRPRLVFLENVWEAFKHFQPIGQRLESLGYTVAPPFRCGAVHAGASHRRNRMFVMAYREGDDEWWHSLTSMHGEGESSGVYRGDVADPQRQSRGTEYVDHPGERPNESPADRAMSGETGPHLAQPPIGGLRELRQSPAGDRQPHGGEPAVADAENSERREHQSRPWEEGGTVAGWPSESLENAPRLSGRQRPGRQRVCQDGEAVENPRRSERRGSEEPAGLDRIGPSDHDCRTGGTLADTRSERPEGQCPEGPETGTTGRSHRADPHAPFLFAPGPDFPGWPDILAAYPHLAPATEPGVCLVADGVAYPLDGSRADSLRAGGNGVVALAGAIAFECLLQHFLPTSTLTPES